MTSHEHEYKNRINAIAARPLTYYSEFMENIAGISSSYSPDIQARINSRSLEIAILSTDSRTKAALDHYVELIAWVVAIASATGKKPGVPRYEEPEQK
jgi:hypothetical protein